MARIHGKSGQVLMDDNNGSPYTPGSPYSPAEVGDISAFTLNMSTERVVVTAFGDTNVRRVAGLPDFSGTLSGWWNSATSPRLFNVILGGLPAFLRLVPNRNENTYYFEGLSNIDGSIDVSATGAVAFSGNFDAADNWSMNP